MDSKWNSSLSSFFFSNRSLRLFEVHFKRIPKANSKMAKFLEPQSSQGDARSPGGIDGAPLPQSLGSRLLAKVSVIAEARTLCEGCGEGGAGE